MLRRLLPEHEAAQAAQPVKHTHLGVYAVLENARRVLLVRKGRGPYRGAWDLPGGKIEWGETPDDALRREVEEETGLHIKEAVLRFALSHKVVWMRSDGVTEKLHHLGLVYHATAQEADVSSKQTPDGEDSDGAFWHDVAALDALPLTPFALHVLQSSE